MRGTQNEKNIEDVPNNYKKPNIGKQLEVACARNILKIPS
jgi:hypothetical protein